MSTQRFRSILIFSGTAVLAAAGWSQTAQPADKAAEKSKEAEEAPAKLELTRFTLGYQSRKVNDYRLGLDHYARVPAGFTLFDAAHTVTQSERWPFVALHFAGSNEDYTGQLETVLSAATVKLDVGNFGYYQSGFGDIRESQDKIFRAEASAPVGGHLGAFATATSTKRERPSVAPAPDQTHHNLEYTVGIGGTTPSGRFDIEGSSRKTSESGGLYPATVRNTLQGSYALNVGERGTVEGQAGTTRINQFGLASSTIDSYALTGSWEFDDTTSLQGRIQQDRYDLGPTLNGYVRKRFVSGLKLGTRIGKWNVQGGFDHKESERLTADQSFVNVPKWNDYSLKLSTRLSSESRLTVRGFKETASSLATVQTNDPRSLMWDERATGQIKLDYVKDDLASYLVYAAGYRKNSFRGVEIDSSNFTLGASYVLSPKASVFGEATRESYRMGAPVGQLGDYLSDYYTDGITYALGFDFAPTTNDAFSVNWNYFQGYASLGYQLNLQFRRKYRPGQSFEINFSPLRYSDRAFGIASYEAQVASLKFAIRQ